MSYNPLFCNGEGSRKVISNPYLKADHCQKLISSSIWSAKS